MSDTVDVQTVFKIPVCFTGRDGEIGRKDGIRILFLLCILVVQALCLPVPLSAETLSSACGSSYAETTRAKQERLLRVFEETIEEGMSKEYVSSLENCLETLRSVFRVRTANPGIPGIAEIWEQARSILERAAERLCQDALARLWQEERRWRVLWEQTTYDTVQVNPDWAIIIQENSRGNASVLSNTEARLREILGGM